MADTTQTHAEGKMLADVEDGVGLITFNQPKKLNAMSVEMWTGLNEILDAFDKDEGVRVVVLTGAGHRAFGSGADISEFEDQRSAAEARVHYDRITREGRARLARFGKPVIARIRGFCLGGGLAIAMQADLRIAAADSTFGIPAAKLGIGYGFDMVETLISLVGPAHARRLLYTGDRIESAEAQRIGLVNRVVPDEDLSNTVVEIARSIADNAPLSVRSLKLEVTEATKHAADRDMDAVNRSIAACFESDDYREGHTAFLEKRAPRFRGA